MGLQARLGHFAKKITFTKAGRRCGSTDQSVILNICIVAFWLANEASVCALLFYLFRLCAAQCEALCRV